MSLLFNKLGEGLLPGTVGLGPGEDLRQWSLTFLAPGTGFMEDNSSADRGRGWRGAGGGRFQDD